MLPKQNGFKTLHEKKISKAFQRGLEPMPKLWCLELSWKKMYFVSANVKLCEHLSVSIAGKAEQWVLWFLVKGITEPCTTHTCTRKKTPPLFMEVVTKESSSHRAVTSNQILATAARSFNLFYGWLSDTVVKISQLTWVRKEKEKLFKSWQNSFGRTMFSLPSQRNKPVSLFWKSRGGRIVFQYIKSKTKH